MMLGSFSFIGILNCYRRMDVECRVEDGFTENASSGALVSHSHHISIRSGQDLITVCYLEHQDIDTQC